MTDPNRIKVKISRGTGTRDSEEWTIEGVGESPEEARENFEDLLADVTGMGGFGDYVREWHPGEDQ